MATLSADLLPYGATGYRYKVVPHDGEPGFEAESFDDAAAGFADGAAGFGDNGCGPPAATSWTGVTDILLRHAIEVPAGTSGVEVKVAIDNDVQVFWNGVDISGGMNQSEGCATYDRFNFGVPAAALQTGTNLLAVRARNRVTGTPQFVDVRVSAEVIAGVPAEQLFGTGSGLHGKFPARMEKDPVNTATGNYATSVTDLALPGRGLGFAFTRAYNSLDPSVGVLGVGWRHAFEARLVAAAGGAMRFIAEDGAQYVYASDGAGGFVTPAGGLSALSSDGSGGYRLTRHDQVAYAFDAAGLLQSLTDRNGNALSLTYSGGQLTQITDTVGRVMSLGYDAAGRLDSLSGPPSRSVGYAYDAAGRLATVTDVRGGTTSYTYDAAGRLATIVDPNGHTLVSNVYGADGRVSQQTNALGETGTFAWDPATQTSTYTDARGGTWLDTYSGNVLVSHTDPLSHTTSYDHDAEINLSSVTDPRGNTTTFTYDAAGNLASRTAPAPGSEVDSWTYTARNDVATFTDGRGHTTTYTYDAAGNLVQIDAPEAATTIFGRDPTGTGLLVSATDPRDETTTFAYDADANLTAVTSPLGHQTGFGYDAAGRLTSLVDPRGTTAGANPADFTTAFAYDAADHLLTQTDPGAGVTTWTYDPAGNLTSRTDPNGHATTWGYDDADQLVSVTDAASGVTAYAYDPVGNLVSRTDANSHVTSYTYDLAGQMVTITDPLSHASSLTYDAAGNLATQTDANGQLTTFSYDARNRLTGVDYADPATPDVTYAYDPNSNLTSLSDGLGSETWSYDELDRLTGVTRGGDAFAYTYDPAGNLLSRTYPDGTLTSYAFDADGRLASVTSGTATTTYAYDPAANPIGTDLPNGVSEARTFDVLGRLTALSASGPAGSLLDQAYTYDAAGNLLSTTDTGAEPAAAITERISESSQHGQGNGLSHEAYISADGRFVTFESEASDLVSGDTNATADVFVHDRVTDTTTRVSVASDGTQADGSSEDPTISPDGRYVAYRSAATNLVAGDTNSKYDIFVFDRQTATTTRVSLASDGSQANGSSDSAVVSRDGTAVVFRSFGRLVPGDTNGESDIYLRDLVAGTTTRVSVASDGTQGNGGSDGPTISDDGQIVAFDSVATNLVAADTNGVRDVFVHEVATGTTSRVSVAADGTQGDADSWEPTLDASGATVAFTSTATTLVANDTNAKDDVFVVTRATGTILRASLGDDEAQSTNHADETSLSADGTLLAFYSTAANLVAGDTNGKGDVFVRDLVNGSTTRWSLTSDGLEGNDRSANPTLSGDGSTVAFHSFATNLVPNDTNGVADVFVRDTGAAASLETTNYTYDALDRLTEACFEPSCASDVVAYTYDPVGNRLSQVTPAGTTTYAYDAADRLTSVTAPDTSVTAATYDPNGNQLTAGADTFSYDAANRLIGATVGGVASSYGYLGDGRRASATSAGVTTGFVWDPNFGLPQLALERDAAGATLRSTTYGLGPLSVTQAGQPSYLHADRLGSIAATSTAAGDPGWSYGYDPFGAERRAEQLDPVAAASPYRFSGQLLDPTGLYHLRARQYDPGSGRFLSTDPVAAALADPYVSSYAYVRNNPLRWTDPSGQCAVAAVPAAALAGGGVLSLEAAGLVAGCAALIALVAWVTQPSLDLQPARPVFPEPNEATQSDRQIYDLRPDPQTAKAHADYVAKNSVGPDGFPPIECRLNPGFCKLIAAVGIGTILGHVFQGGGSIEEPLPGK